MASLIAKGSKFRIISLAVSLFILGLLLYFSNIREVVSVVSTANPVIILFGAGLFCVSMAGKNFRWKILLRQLGIKLDFRKLFPVFMGSMFISNITPAKSGDPVRSYLLKRRTGISFSRTLPSVVMERIMDIIVTIVIAVIGLFFVQLAWLTGAAALAIAIYGLAMALVLYVSTSEKRMSSFFRKITRVFGWIPRFREIKKKSRKMALNFNRSFVKYRKKPLVPVFLLTVFVWLVESTIVYLSFLSIGIQVSFLFCVFVLVLAVLIGVVSSLPGGLGSSEAVMAFLFTSTAGLPVPTAMAGVLIARFLTLWLTIIVGALFFRV